MKKFILFLILGLNIALVNAQVFVANSGASIGRIPDGVSTPTCFPLTISGVGTIDSNYGLASVTINIAHTWDADLTIKLVAPDGTSVDLSTKRGGSSNNYTNTIFTDTALRNIGAGTAPFTGYFKPESLLGVVNNGQNANGVWTLCVSDGSTTDSGSVLNWTLVFNNVPNYPPGSSAGGTGIPPCLNNSNAAPQCTVSPLVCNFDGLCGKTPALQVTHTWPELTAEFTACLGGASIENNSFIQFVATSDSAFFHVWIYNSNNGSGLQMLFYDGGCGSGPVTSYGCKNNMAPTTSGSPDSIIATGLTPGQTYYIMFDGYAGDLCSYTIQPVYGVSVFTIDINPDVKNVCRGTQIKFKAISNDSTALYHWSTTNGPASLSDTTTAATTVNTNVLPAGPTTFTLNATTSTTNLCPTTKSKTINVVDIPTVINQPMPATQTVDVNDIVPPYTVSSTGLVTYQWFVNTTNSYIGGIPFSGGDSLATTFTPSTLIAGTYYFYCYINSGGCSVRSNIVQLIVKNLPACTSPDSLAFVQQPTNTPQGLIMKPFVKVKIFCKTLKSTDTTYTGLVTLRIKNACGFNTQTVNAVNGIATFKNIVITRSIQNGAYFVATAQNIPDSTVSIPFNITTPATVVSTDTIRAEDFSPSATAPWIFSNSPVGINGGTVANNVSGVIQKAGNYYLRKSYAANSNQGGPGSIDTFSFSNVTGLAIYTPLTLTFKIASLNQNGTSGITNGAGADIGEDLIVQTSIDGGQTWKKLLTHTGFSNKLFQFSDFPSVNLTLGVNKIIAIADTTSAFKVSIPAGTNQFQFRVIATNNRTQENWSIDDIYLYGTKTTIIASSVLPTVVALSDTTICAGSTVQLGSLITSGVGSIKYSWSPASGFPNLLDSSKANPTTNILNTNQVYTLSIVDQDNCEGTSAPITVKVTNQSPVILSQKTNTDSVCIGGKLKQLSIAAQFTNKYEWYQNTANSNTGGVLVASSKDSFYLPNSSLVGTYYYYCKAVGACNSIISSVSGAIVVNPKPVISIVGNLSICKDSSTTLTASGADVYNWINGPITSTYTVSPTVNTSYSVIGTNSTTGCFDTAKVSVSIGLANLPNFTQIAPVCNGTSFVLPDTSINGIVGKWSPAIDNTNTTTYTFTPNAGQCAVTTTMTVTIIAKTVPTFMQVASICDGGSFVLPLISTNSISGTWVPNIDNTKTTTYTFIPSAGQCAATNTMTVIVTPKAIPKFTQVPAICNGGTFTLPISSNEGFTGTWSPAINNTATTTYTFTPTPGQCATTTTMTVTVNNTLTVPTFTQIPPICIGDPAFTLPNTSNNGIVGVWLPSINTSATTTYTFTPTSGQCADVATMKVVVNNKTSPTFTITSPVCEGTLFNLPTPSNNGITGTWAPAINNTSTTIYSFTPTNGQCATATTAAVVITNKALPTFNQITPICEGSTLTLPTISINGFTGSWSPAVNNTATTTYTFTPDAGQCATTAQMTVIVNSKTVPTFVQVSPICEGGTFTLPTNSTNTTNVVTGSWTPSINSSATTTYTFNPNAGQCATNASMTVVVNLKAVPTFIQVAGICRGGSIVLPTTSTNGYIGNWNPPINNNDSTTYTFIPNVGQCATTTIMSVDVTTKPTVAPIAGPSVVAINQTITLKNNTIGGIWLATPPSLASINSVGEVKGVSPGTLSIKYVKSNFCGEDSAKYLVTVLAPDVFIPNLFTPNGDGKNDLFYVRGSSTLYNFVELKIFDSWGSIIFESKGLVNDKSIAWDGKSKGKVQPTGVYIYLIKLLTTTGETIVKKGSISLIR